MTISGSSTELRLGAPDAVQRVALAERCTAEPGPGLPKERNRGPGSAERHEECRTASGTREMDHAEYFATAASSQTNPRPGPRAVTAPSTISIGLARIARPR